VLGIIGKTQMGQLLRMNFLTYGNYQGCFTLGLRKAEQSLKTGLFYYDEIPTPSSPRACASPCQPKNFNPLEGNAQPSSARTSAEQGRC